MLVLAVAATSMAGVRSATAADGIAAALFGEKDTAITEGYAYGVSLNVEASGSDDIKQLIASTSRLMVEQARGASDAYALVARARSDVAQIEAALYSAGHYAGVIDIRVAGQPIEGLDPASLGGGDSARPEVAINVTPGPRFVFGNVEIVQVSHHGEGPSLSAADLGLRNGDTAGSSLIIAASEKIVEAWRSAGFPLARIIDKQITADHARNTVDIRLHLDPGPPAVYGWVGVSGAPNLDHETLLAQSKLKSGNAYRPKDIKRARDRLVKMPGIESVRVVEGDRLDANGGIPVNLEVSERKPRYFGATASLSTTDGAEIEAHWGHRNLFGEGEHLRFEGSVARIGSEALDRLEFDAAAIYTKAGILDVDTDLVSEFRLTREHPDAYDSLDVSAKVGLAHVFSPVLSGSATLAAKFSQTTDAFGDNRYLLLSVPLEAVYDTRDRRLDATRGVSVMASLTPALDTIGGAGFVKSDVQFASYLPLADEGRTVLAARIGMGSIAGASAADVPASTRFFGGGGGSVRGYEYRSIGPLADGKVAGGLGYVGTSLELRQRLTQSFGIVTFIDAISVTEKSYPDFNGDFYVGAGVGLRYFTVLGPLRIDVATPLNERDGRPPVAVYVGLGQAF
ncbi:MAG: outer membrane protein assembly factor [Hyphomicrobiaceae bacterium]|nr:outer membrane protein assembly factor [Hyphomicrobiaceae bacterium]